MSVLKFVESSGIIYGTLLSNPSSELSKIDDITANTSFITENSGHEAYDRERTNDFISKTGESVGIFRVSSNE